MARSWAKDKIYLGEHIVELAEKAKAEDNKLSLMIFPEGTLVSRDTRPLSKKYADKIGIVRLYYFNLNMEPSSFHLSHQSDLQHTLLPRSTGLLFILRSMGPAIPDLKVLDITIGYPGIPPAGYGQDFYTLRSIFVQGIAPPEIHLHMRLYNLSDIPIGAVSKSDSVGRGAEATPEETTAFDKWLVERWTEKDRMMDAFYRDGAFPSPDGVLTTKKVEVPVKLRAFWEIGNAFCFLAPLAVYYGFKSVLTQ